MSINAITTPAQDITPEQAAADAAQTRMSSLVQAAIAAGPQDDSTVTPTYMLRLAVKVNNLTVPGSLSVRAATPGEVLARKGTEAQGFMFTSTRYMTPEQDEAWRAACGKTTSLHKARAAAAKTLGFTEQDLADLAFVAAAKRPSKSRDNLVAWLRAAGVKVGE